MIEREPLFPMFSRIGLCVSLKLLLFFQANGTAGFGGLNFVGLALVGKDIVFRFIIKYPLVPLANSTLIILFVEMLKFSTCLKK